MLYQISRRTLYTYDSPVTVAHYIARLEPRPVPTQNCGWHEIIIRPRPACRVDGRSDAFGNTGVYFEIESTHPELEVVARSYVRLKPRPLPDPAGTPPWETVREACRGRESRGPGTWDPRAPGTRPGGPGKAQALVTRALVLAESCLKHPPLHGYGDAMKHITISVDNELYEEARGEAARRRKSLSALVREFLAGLRSREAPPADPEWQQLYDMVDRKHARRKGSAGPLNRDEMHERGISGY